MNNRSPIDSKKPASSIYQITVKGALTEKWAEWFNGMLISYEHNNESSPNTILTCQVRDQAELNGILNWLHNLNLTLVRVMMLPKTYEERKRDET